MLLKETIRAARGTTEGVIACMQTAQANCITVRKHIKLYNNPTPLEFIEATSNDMT